MENTSVGVKVCKLRKKIVTKNILQQSKRILKEVSSKDIIVARRKERKEMKDKAFTLMELLVVMAIIAILAGMAVGGAQMARKRGAVTKAKAAISALEAAIDMYDMDMGGYPPSGNTILVQALTENADSGEDWNGPYMRFKEEDLKEGAYLDPWGNPYVYLNPGTHNPNYYDLYSFGPNGQDEQGEGDDINNW